MQSAKEYLKTEVNRTLQEAHSITEKAEKENRSLAAEERENAEGLLKSVGEMRIRIADIEDNEKLQESIDAMRTPMTNASEGKREAKTIGEAFTKSDAFRALKSGALSGQWSTGPVELNFDAKATITTAASGGAIPVDFQPGMLPILTQPLRISDLLLSGSTTSNTIRYVQETTATNVAGPVAEGLDKPESTLIMASVDEPVRKIATFLPVADEMLEDVAQLESYINGRLALFVQQAEEAQLYGGTGIAPNLLGIVSRTGVQTQAKGTDSVPDAIFKAMTKVRNTFLEPDGIVMHPSDYEDIRLAKDANQQYYGGGPFMGPYGVGGVSGDSLWGKPVVVTTAATAGTALVGAFRTAAQVFRRNTLSVEASNSHSDFFRKNLTAIRAEQRLGLAVFRPSAFCTVTGV